MYLPNNHVDANATNVPSLLHVISQLNNSGVSLPLQQIQFICIYGHYKLFLDHARIIKRVLYEAWMPKPFNYI